MGNGKARRSSAKKGQTGAVVQPPVQPEDPEPGAVIEGRVLKGPPARDLDELHVDLDRLPGLGLFEELDTSIGQVTP
jgi:hypothetical protein